MKARKSSLTAPSPHSHEASHPQARLQGLSEARYLKEPVFEQARDLAQTSGSLFDRLRNPTAYWAAQREVRGMLSFTCGPWVAALHHEPSFMRALLHLGVLRNKGRTDQTKICQLIATSERWHGILGEKYPQAELLERVVLADPEVSPRPDEARRYGYTLQVLDKLAHNRNVRSIASVPRDSHHLTPDFQITMTDGTQRYVAAQCYAIERPNLVLIEKNMHKRFSKAKDQVGFEAGNERGARLFLGVTDEDGHFTHANDEWWEEQMCGWAHGNNLKPPLHSVTIMAQLSNGRQLTFVRKA